MFAPYSTRFVRLCVALLLPVVGILSGCSPADSSTAAISMAASTPPAIKTSEKSVAAPSADDGPETWFAMFIEGAKVGYAHNQTTKFTESGKTLAKIDEEVNLSVNRNGQRTDQRIVSSGVETSDGELLRFQSTIDSAIPEPIITTGTMHAGQMILETKTTGKTIPKPFTSPRPIRHRRVSMRPNWFAGRQADAAGRNSQTHGLDARLQSSGRDSTDGPQYRARQTAQPLRRSVARRLDGDDARRKCNPFGVVDQPRRASAQDGDRGAASGHLSHHARYRGSRRTEPGRFRSAAFRRSCRSIGRWNMRKPRNVFAIAYSWLRKTRAACLPPARRKRSGRSIRTPPKWKSVPCDRINRTADLQTWAKAACLAGSSPTDLLRRASATGQRRPPAEQFGAKRCARGSSRWQKEAAGSRARPILEETAVAAPN